MNIEHEEIIVKTFFIKRIQDRVLFELSTRKKKRKDALSRLSHNYKKVLDENYMLEIPKPNSDYMEIAKLLQEYGAGVFCYVISWNNVIDGKELPLKIALEQVIGSGMPTLISCISNKLIYFEAEQVNGAPPRYILKKN